MDRATMERRLDKIVGEVATLRRALNPPPIFAEEEPRLVHRPIPMAEPTLKHSRLARVRFVNGSGLSPSAYPVNAGTLPRIRKGDVVQLIGENLAHRSGVANGVVVEVITGFGLDPSTATATKIVGHVADSWRCRP